MSICWHSWTKWKDYIEKGTMQRHPFAEEMIPYCEERQERHCQTCNKKQTRRVRVN